MKRVTYDMKIKVVVDMPDDADPVDEFIECNYEFFFGGDGIELVETDIYDESHKVEKL